MSTPPEIRKEAEKLDNSALPVPEKSKAIYLKKLPLFIAWLEKRNLPIPERGHLSPSVVAAYVQHLLETLGIPHNVPDELRPHSFIALYEEARNRSSLQVQQNEHFFLYTGLNNNGELVLLNRVIGKNALGNLVRESAKYLKLTGGKFTVHSLRKSAATWMIENGGTAVMAMQHLGHNNVKTTLGYVQTSRRMQEQRALMLAGGTDNSQSTAITSTSSSVTTSTFPAKSSSKVIVNNPVYNFSGLQNCTINLPGAEHIAKRARTESAESEK
jgi:hypothetical protein